MGRGIVMAAEEDIMTIAMMMMVMMMMMMSVVFFHLAVLFRFYHVLFVCIMYFYLNK